jgi:hypothetical protein
MRAIDRRNQRRESWPCHRIASRSCEPGSGRPPKSTRARCVVRAIREKREQPARSVVDENDLAKEVATEQRDQSLRGIGGTSARSWISDTGTSRSSARFDGAHKAVAEPESAKSPRRRAGSA